MESALSLILIFVIFFAFGYGTVKAFQRNWLAALLLLLFFLPGLIVWAFVECFLGPAKQKVYNVRVVKDEDQG